MSLQAKILQLKLEAALAHRHANGWQRLIDLYGEPQATAFYTHLGLNHLPRKSYDYDGLKLSREPKPHEAPQVKAIAQAQESAKERLSTMMASIRNELVTNALDRLAQLKPANYHKLIVTVGKDEHALLRDLVTETFNDGRLLIAAQRSGKQDDDVDYDDELDDLTDITASRLANDVQARVTGAASRFALLGQFDSGLINSVTNEIHAASISYVDRAATGLANRTLNLGRSAEASRFDWQRVEYSALLDANVCGPCATADGQEATNEDDLTPAPNPECEGYDNCRCFHVFVQD
jgi:hypothetical protein